ncbi:MAG: electron transport complex subunit RsxA [Clostridia bacterium]|nr:electron transport complex subunit RsxA [Clostridia bacterium]MBR4979046.1 electron transport complex subunit RsxA [Clostridia bacterium]
MSLAAMFSLLISSILINNYIFSRFLGICPFLGLSEKTSTAVGMGCAVTFVMTVSTAVTWCVYHYVLVPFELEYLKTIAFILVIASLVQLLEMFLRKSVPSLYSALGIYLPLITTNCAILGSALLCIQNGYNFVTSIIFSFGSALGFTMAIVIFSFVREKVALAETPKSFKGTPIALVTAGLIAMAFAGFSGIKLPF